MLALELMQGKRQYERPQPVEPGTPKDRDWYFAENICS